MKTLRIISVSLLLLVLLSAAVFAGGKGEKVEGPVEVNFMSTPADLPDEFIQSFNANHEMIDIIRTEFNWTKFVTDAMAGTASDLMRLGSGTEVPYYVKRGLLYDMTDYLKNGDLIDFDDIDKKGNVEYNYDGKWWGLSKDYNNIGCITYNKQMFKQAGIPMLSTEEPITYDTMYELAEQLTQKDENGDVVVWGYDFNPLWIQYLSSDMARMKGVDLLTPDDKKMNDVPEVREILEYWTQYPVNDISSNVNNPATAWAGATFQSDRVAIIQLGYWYGAQLMENDNYEEKYGWAPTPVLEKGGPRATNTLGATGIVMYAGTKVPDQAYEVFEWYMAGEYGKHRAETGWGIPPLKSLRDLLPKNNEYNRTRLEIALDDAQYFKPVLAASPYVTRTVWQNAWTGNIDPLVTGDITVDEFIDAYMKHVNDALATGAAEFE